jgi:hypothetical protein
LSITQVSVDLQVNGVAETTAGITLTGPNSLSVPVTYSGTSTVNCLTAANYVADALWSSKYGVGNSYTLTIVTSAGTVSVSATAPGGSLACNAEGSQVTWGTGGNHDYLQIFREGTLVFEAPPDITTNYYDVPSTAYPESGAYKLRAVVSNYTDGIVGASSYSYFAVGDALEITVNK